MRKLRQMALCKQTLPRLQKTNGRANRRINLHNLRRKLQRKTFLQKCYAKYKDRSVDIRITHCTETEILDEYGNLQYKCDDGRKVRSRAEKIICFGL